MTDWNLTTKDLIQTNLLLDSRGENKIANYEIVESDFLNASDIINIDGVKIEIQDETKDVSTEWGMKPQCKVKVSVGVETHMKTISFNKPMMNYLVKNLGKDSKEWIGKVIPITTKHIKGNDAIVPKTE